MNTLDEKKEIFFIDDKLLLSSDERAIYYNNVELKKNNSGLFYINFDYNSPIINKDIKNELGAEVLNIDRLKLFGPFPSKDTDDDLQLFISKQNAMFIKQPFIRIANTINYSYRSMEQNLKKEILYSISLIESCIEKTYALKQDTNSKKDKYHLRLSLLYTLLQLSIASSDENLFVKTSNKVVNEVLIVKGVHNFKDSFFNIIKSFNLISIYIMKSKSRYDLSNIFSLNLELSKRALNSFDSSRVEKTYLEFSESIKDLHNLKKLSNGNGFSYEKIFLESIRTRKNNNYSLKKFMDFKFNTELLRIYDI